MPPPDPTPTPADQPGQGFFVVVEGPSGTGKTTITALLHQQLTHRGVDVVATREPTHAPAGELARHGTDTYRGLALACLVAADRYHHLEHVVRPAVAAGQLVLCDRYVPSSLVLQQLDGVPSAYLRMINGHALVPNLTIFLTLDPAQARARAAARGITSRFHRGGATAGRAEAATYRRVARQLARAGHAVHQQHVRDAPEVVAAGLIAVITQAITQVRPSPLLGTSR